MGKPKNPPEKGERVKLRGRSPRGTLRSINDLSWCCVEWDDGGPGLCHLHELEKEDRDG